ncbi:MULTISPECIES: MBL fold metallo-hydrolase [Salimicrobium]|uniref:MBL fold metallo-hydrolase n=1 Tax=Salimicrobium humidisoli TaxID=2029857 RepID=A0ABX4HQQ3_9BACI|nr:MULTISPECIES: MBL fold metallo-hydrolase [Salimicrobium]PBB05526.1 MBL fold metallo-hydrolase [Salimicrobium humidisoli]
MKDDIQYGEDYKNIPATSKESGRFGKLAENLWYHTVQIVNLCYVANVSNGGWVLIDAGMPNSSDDIINRAEETFGKDNPPEAIVLTHGHFDHVGSIVELVEYWNVPVYAHERELPFLRGEKAYMKPDSSVQGGAVAKLSGLFPKDPVDLGDKVYPLPQDGSVPFLEEWEWIHTPGHTPGHVSFFRKSDQALIAGDAFTTVKQENLMDVTMQKKDISGPPRYFTPDWKAAHTSVRRLRDLNPARAITGHGLPMENNELSKNLSYLADNFEEIAVPDYGRHVEDEE